MKTFFADDDLLALLPGAARSPAAIPDQPGLIALTAPHAARLVMLNFAAHLALRGPLRVLDGGNRFNAYLVARALRALQPEHPARFLARIQIARAFTCYQMAALVNQSPSQPGEAPQPLLVLDMLDTFYDQSVSLEERRRLTEICANRLHHLGRLVPIAISLRPPPPGQPDSSGLLDLILSQADLVWTSMVDQVLAASAGASPTASTGEGPVQLKLF